MHGGADCPGLGMIGILNSLSLANPLSNVILLTDASPKDLDKKDEVIGKAIRKENSIHFFSVALIVESLHHFEFSQRNIWYCC